MSNRPTAVGAALREAGFVPLPRLWVRREELRGIISIATKHADEINAIRASIWDGEKPG